MKKSILPWYMNLSTDAGGLNRFWLGELSRQLSSCALVGIGALLPMQSLAQPSVLGSWTAPVQTGVQYPSNAVILKNGLALVCGSVLPGGNCNYYNPILNVWYGAGYTTPQCPGQASLGDGTVLWSGTDSAVIRTSFFDPGTGLGDQRATALVARYYPTLTMLADGRILLMAGDAVESQYPLANVPEVYDPALTSFDLLPGAGHCGPPSRMGVCNPPNNFYIPTYPLMFTLSDGRVLFAGGSDDDVFPSDLSTQSRVLNVGTQTWTLMGQSTPDQITGEAAVMWGRDVVIKVGGYKAGGTVGIKEAWKLDLTVPTPTWTPLASPVYHCVEFHLTALPDGKLLATCGSLTPELYDPAADTAGWEPMAAMTPLCANTSKPRGHHAIALLLPDARVLVAGGQPYTENCSSTHTTCPDLLTGWSTTAEIFSPPYLFKPDNTSVGTEERPYFPTGQPGAPAEVGTGSKFTVANLQAGATSVDKACFIRLGSSTHEIDMEQRYVPVPFTWTGKIVTAPETTEQAPPGYYMLFFLNNLGRPSKAEFVRVWGIPQTSISHSIGLSCAGGHNSLTFTASWNTTRVTTGTDSLFIWGPTATCGAPLSAMIATASSGGRSHQVTKTINCANGTYKYVVKSYEGGTSKSLCKTVSVVCLSCCSPSPCELE